MSLNNFAFNKVRLQKTGHDIFIHMKGEIINNSGRSYSSVAFRAMVLKKTFPIGNVTFLVNGFVNGQTREFDVQINELRADKLGDGILTCELYAESGY